MYNGFTLIEMMIVVVIMAILVSIAVPSYQRYVERARRAVATDMLMQAAARQERYYSDNASFGRTADLGYTVNADGWIENGDATYQFRVLDATTGCPIATCYEIEVKPVNSTQRDQRQFKLHSSGKRESREDGSATWGPGWPKR